MKPCVLFVDDESEACALFQRYFEKEFQVLTASNGSQALSLLKRQEEIQVVISDLRMPHVNGLELLRDSKEMSPGRGFIIVSGEGDREEIAHAYRMGARNFLRKPYPLSMLAQLIREECQRYSMFRSEQAHRQQERSVTEWIEGVQNMRFLMPPNMSWVHPLTFYLMGIMESNGLCSLPSCLDVALSVSEIFANSVEHGCLRMLGEDKVILKAQGEDVFAAELQRREQAQRNSSERVIITATIQPEYAQISVEDPGPGFNYQSLPDPEDPENLFLSSGRGLMLAHTFLSDLRFEAPGNKVIMCIHRKNPKTSPSSRKPV